MSTIKVPDVPTPAVRLCWKQSPGMVRCDRAVGHGGRHTWEMAKEIADLQAQLAEKEPK